MIPQDTTPMHTEIHDAEQGMREFAMIEAINFYCYAERSRSRMLMNLREALLPHDVLILDAACWRSKRAVK